MPPLPYALVRPFLFGMDPEKTHELTLHALEKSQGTPLQWLYSRPQVQDPIDLAGLRFPNRIGLAAGLDKNARCIDAWAQMGFGFVEVGTVTPKAQTGNPKPRIFRLPQAGALINRLGFNNEGLDAFIAHVQKSRVRQTNASGQGHQEHRSPLILGLNIGKNASTPIEQANEDYRLGLHGVYAHADYVSVNISSPNTAHLRALQNDQALDSLLAMLAQERQTLHSQYGKHVPIFLKIAPDLEDDPIDWIARALVRHGMDGVIATNTTIQRDAVNGLPHAQETGGLSGQPLQAMSNRVIRRLRDRLGPTFPIIGVGGVLSAADALAKIDAGADVVQIYTGLIYRGPGLVQAAAQALAARSKRSGAQPAAT